jgi:hypothetical protein
VCLSKLWLLQWPCANVAHSVLNRTYPGRWIGCGVPKILPAHSPNLIPLDLFLQETPKSTVYRDILTSENMWQNIIEYATMNLHITEWTSQSFTNHCNSALTLTVTTSSTFCKSFWWPKIPCYSMSMIFPIYDFCCISVYSIIIGMVLCDNSFEFVK